MFQVKPMREQDFGFATKLANTMHWNMALEDFKLNKNLEPDGCFVAFHGRERIGVATCISYGDLGWFGNLIVKEKYRKQGVGSLLVKHAVAYLQAKGVKTIGLYAYPHLTGFYGGLGFKRDEDFSVMHTQTLTASPTAGDLPTVGAGQVESIEQFDSLCFGANRKRVLEPIILGKGNLCYCVSDNAGIVGYVAGTVYWTMASVGPLACREGEVDVAVTLLKAILGQLSGQNVYAVVPKKQAALLNILSNAGFQEEYFLVRMYLGINKAKNCIYMTESLERG